MLISVNNVNSVNSVNSVSNYGAVLPKYLMVLFVYRKCYKSRCWTMNHGSKIGDPVCILSLIFRYYLTKMKYLNLHSLFEVKLEKHSKKRSIHSIITWKNGVPQLSLFDGNLEKRSKKWSTHFIILWQKRSTTTFTFWC